MVHNGYKQSFADLNTDHIKEEHLLHMIENGHSPQLHMQRHEMSVCFENNLVR